MFKHKVFTLGWLSVLIFVVLMNYYISRHYFAYEFKQEKHLKRSFYLVIHIMLSVFTAWYFYLFFTGQTGTHLSNILSYFSAFYFGTLYYTSLFYLLYDLIAYLSRKISLKLPFQKILHRLFFAGIPIFMASMILTIVGIAHSHDWKTTRYSLTLPKNESTIEHLNIVYLSDGHMGTSLNRSNI